MSLISYKIVPLFLGLFFLQLLFFYPTQANNPPEGKTIRVLQFNIWQEGTVVQGGFQAVVDEIIRTQADLVCLSEVRNYNNTLLNQRLVEALAAKGFRYYAEKSLDSGILSRYPIRQQWDFFPVKDDRGSITKALIDMEGHQVVLYSAHLDYRNCSLYLPKGYDGSTWDELPAPITDTVLIAADNLKSNRDEAIDAFIKDAEIEKQKGRIVILGGDFNEPSCFDWTKETRNLADHQGVVIKWRNTAELTKAGFIDAYRQMFPDPVTHPGFTFPADNPAVPLKKLAWSPKADDRDRIDFIFYHPDPRLQLQDVKLVGPRGSVVRNERIQETSSDPFDIPTGIWPTDHKAILATFLFK
jgi:endonuclease/exonuclease/phosphatase family metal-dependent hydrolase